MSRQEDFIDAGIEYRFKQGKPMAIGGDAFGDMTREMNRTKPFEAGAEYGYQYALQHPQWIPVEERLPKHDVEENGLITYQEVLVSLYDGYVGTDTYDTQLKAWWQYEGEVEYWMPLPIPPQGKEE